MVASLRHVLEQDPDLVSIPFIAGQWSLHVEMEDDSSDNVQFQSPSLRGSGRFAETRTKAAYTASCFNPLHCGAVVASECGWIRFLEARDVSIPFIAGQWSLRADARGAGPAQGVSIPFIAGQWSLLGGRTSR